MCKSIYRLTLLGAAFLCCAAHAEKEAGSNLIADAMIAAITEPAPLPASNEPKPEPATKEDLARSSQDSCGLPDPCPSHYFQEQPCYNNSRASRSSRYCGICNYCHPDHNNPQCNCDCAPPPAYHCCGRDEEIAKGCGLIGIWLPECSVLFRPLMADPRQVTYSVGWRFNDQVLVKNVIDVSFGDSIPFYRWFNVPLWCGDLQVELEGALWAVFDPLHDSSPLMNADYYVGGLLTYAVGPWSMRLRGYHISSHIGDEFLLNHPHFHRRNASSEFVDYYISLDWTDDIRVYSGIGYTIGEDEEFHTGRWFGGLGTEVRMRCLGFTNWCNQLYGEPFLAMHFRYNKDFRHHVDSTYVLGYEWGKLCGLCRKLRLYMEYHDGYSLEGQYCKKPTNYFSIRTSYGY